ncbi:Nitric oxide-dependent regulator DnrN or NorA [Fulvivirga imtechensis AK7]|uniref:Nitric oxide-dependent regulator DnrN or NorA n=1 Tax=Fulvivirga imtechensis AK7 TaxID=1237149 RepID=L8JYA5_9BACT|nr:hemerythrin domain-containing protein [Fulvivirga imtechensis]ELR72187.1 Nitric oxide-dependent regulator DnrN or NorA [Fulvivirga imtechensis AK7]
MNNRKITDIVDANYVHASVLFYLGIEFYDYSQKTLEQVCQEKGLNVNSVIKKLESVSNCKEENLSLREYPIDLIVEYLKHTHYIFIKQKLPYIARLIESFEAGHPEYAVIERDLKFVFPLFVEDFIHHIYQEEDTLFSYIIALHRYVSNKGNISQLYFMLERHSLQRYAVEHSEHDDEMRGIRRITNGYQSDAETPLHVRVIYAELQALEKNLITHAKVENEILFPKALMLEKEVKARFQEKIRLN